MRIAVIDADLIGSKNHRFPNLVSMKLSGYHKEQGDQVALKLDYNNLDEFDGVYISKVFEDTFVDESILKLENVIYGGTGFYYDDAPPLPDEIEHHMPDYHLYDEWVQLQLDNGAKPKDLRFYTDYSIGFVTRGCFRKCSYCCNRNKTKSVPHSPVDEFYDKSRKYILLLDDNFLACKDWKRIIHDLQKIGKPFQFKQGLDERILTEESCKEIFQNSKYHEDYIFAFDNFEDREFIESKLKLVHKYKGSKCPKFYVFCGYQHPDREYGDFFTEDIIELFKRINILKQHDCIPYVMRHKNYLDSPYSGVYKVVAAWCNQVSLFKKMPFKDFAIQRGMDYRVYKNYKDNYQKYLDDGYSKGSSWRYVEEFEKQHPDIAKQYFYQ